MERVISALGILVFIGISYAISVNRHAVRWRTIAWGLGLEFILALVILKTSWGLKVFKSLGDIIGNFLAFSDVGAKFVFGENFKDHFFAFQVLPTIIFFSSFIGVLYHYGILQRVVSTLAWVMMKTMKTSGSESLSCAGNIFLGPTEAALMVKPYVANMTQSELFAVMTGGFATIAGGVLGAYLSFGIPAEHLVAAFFMTAPTSLMVSKLIYPETEVSETAGKVNVETKSNSVNVIDAATTGALDGVKLAVNVGVMIIAFLGLLAAVNALLGWLGTLVGLPQLSLEWMLSFIMFPVAWLMGIPWADCGKIGALLGKKTILNEFLAYLDLSELIKQEQISQRSIIIATYALCNFANIGTIGITIGSMTGMAPKRQHDLARMGVKSMIGGLLSGFITAGIAGMLI
ncbi:NupC/NupG family nucleoside CNT transporter [Sphaerospermopsis kisseleviana CS-549]|uniref:Nucleoside permease n=2 Tax=Sphaerospermopsis TaxID=752201 RepID=A0A480A0F6_9CYAN|nr:MULTISPECIES: NupC/NupG family nucleoside CNT transporter [Sphaerospermopsis]BAZ80778.1 Na+ dependent nucleoside transporter [Sphaerospermopsis kisseleviana NIES-73]MBD2135126.1 NupC/NupG family nucleoside CNT transporter [Sphaerospermopsis sp. FACHB-1094]MBD2147618.1 NupC/NupG family nucleoside CNT transporter [Sphaerospermopsis sp. FACHB-1194]MDB9444119.1 NupC/NupG family nucleoside CNT transporter [Sphaerospermopsis kisseleviana CS-549]GCL36998.1 Na+ dependent nucleoside transporter [Sph